MNMLLSREKTGIAAATLRADRARAHPGPTAPETARPDGSFQAFQCRADDLTRVFARRSGYGPIAPELMPMVQRLGLQPAGGFADLSQLKAQACGGDTAPPGAGTIRAMRDLFLEVPNGRLQRLYRAHLRAFPPAPATPHQDKIASLAALQDAAQAVVAGFDWRWLADWLHLDRIDGSAEDCVSRLSNLAFRIQQVNFRFTYHCNIECKHCYNSSGPHAKAQRIELDAMLGIVAQMPEAGIAALNLTGGEPFLYPDELIALVAAGRSARLQAISIFTNGFWAATAEKARAMLERLAAAGFMQGAGDFMKVSTGVYHQEFIAFDRVGTLARCFHEMFGRRLTVSYELAPGKSGLAEAIKRQVTADGLEPCVSLYFREALPLGRGSDLDGATLQNIDTPCRLIDQIAFDPDGSARPCGGFNNDNHGVRIGHLKSHRLRDLVKRMQNDPILQFLASRPMSAIFEHVHTKRYEAGYAGTCSLCQHAVGDLTDKEALQARMFDAQEFYPFWFALPAAEEGH